MPELPDIELYVARIRERTVGETLERLRPFNAFVIRSVSPTPAEIGGQRVESVSRIGKRVVLELEGEAFVVIHLMISGRLAWLPGAASAARPKGKITIANFEFACGTLSLSEASTRKRASIHLVNGREGLRAFERGGLDVLSATSEEFAQRLTQTNRTLKRALTEPQRFDGIGNAFSDEILFAAQLSPVRQTQSLTPEEIARLHQACAETLAYWRDHLQATVTGFPKSADVTAFRPDYAVHGRFGLPCRVCEAPIQRIVFAENETNYCARCQNEGRLLADRSLSRLLKDDWPKTLEEMVGG